MAYGIGLEVEDGKIQIKEIPRHQSYVNRQSLDKIFNAQKAKAAVSEK
jgi:hypothetical protein